VEPPRSRLELYPLARAASQALSGSGRDPPSPVGSGPESATCFPGSSSLSNRWVSVGESIRRRKSSGISAASPELMEWPLAKCDAPPSTAASSRAWASDAASMMTTSPPKNVSHHIVCQSLARHEIHKSTPEHLQSNSGDSVRTRGPLCGGASNFVSCCEQPTVGAQPITLGNMRANAWVDACGPAVGRSQAPGYRLRRNEWIASGVAANRNHASRLSFLHAGLAHARRRSVRLDRCA
jgi:hypothetical protein